MATAHPSKFPKAIDEAIGVTPNLPVELKYIMSAKENYFSIPNDLEEIKKYILSKI